MDSKDTSASALLTQQAAEASAPVAIAAVDAEPESPTPAEALRSTPSAEATAPPVTVLATPEAAPAAVQAVAAVEPAPPPAAPEAPPAPAQAVDPSPTPAAVEPAPPAQAPPPPQAVVSAPSSASAPAAPVTVTTSTVPVPEATLKKKSKSTPRLKEHETIDGEEDIEEAEEEEADDGGETSEEERNEASQAFDYPENMRKDEVMERSPLGRFVRFNRKLGSGSYKVVFLGFDNDTGMEVAWNIISFQNLDKKAKKRISEEINMLKNLKHPKIIAFINAWTNKEKEQVCFITERITGGSLLQYIKRINAPLKQKVIKNWCRQILEGLNYLHTRPDPVIHRDLKCDNIFINGNRGDIVIGDLGLSTTLKASCARSIVGTIDFIAPEIYDEKYGTAVDIYAFGMVLLEMIGREQPWSECETAGQVYKKVMAGERPRNLLRVKDELLRGIVMQCSRMKPEDRPSALQLLEHKWLAEDEDSGGGNVLCELLAPDEAPLTIPDLDIFPKLQLEQIPEEDEEAEVAEPVAQSLESPTPQAPEAPGAPVAPVSETPAVVVTPETAAPVAPVAQAPETASAPAAPDAPTVPAVAAPEVGPATAVPSLVAPEPAPEAVETPTPPAVSVPAPETAAAATDVPPAVPVQPELEEEEREANEVEPQDSVSVCAHSEVGSVVDGTNSHPLKRQELARNQEELLPASLSSTEHSFTTWLRAVRADVITECVINAKNSRGIQREIRFDFDKTKDNVLLAAFCLFDEGSVDKGMGFEKLTRDIEHAVMTRCKDLIGTEAGMPSIQAAAFGLHSAQAIGTAREEGFAHAAQSKEKELTDVEDSKVNWSSLGWPAAKRPPLSSDLEKKTEKGDELRELREAILLLQRSLAYLIPKVTEDYFLVLGEWCKQTTEAVELFRSYHSIKEEKGVVDAKIWDKLADEVKKKDEKEAKKKEDRLKDQLNRRQEKLQRKEHRNQESSETLKNMMDLCQVNLGAVTGGKTTVSTAETAATSKGKASTAETASSNGTRTQQTSGNSTNIAQSSPPKTELKSQPNTPRGPNKDGQSGNMPMPPQSNRPAQSQQMQSAQSGHFIPGQQGQTQYPQQQMQGQQAQQSGGQWEYNQQMQNAQQNDPMGFSQPQSQPQAQPQQQSTQTQGPYPQQMQQGQQAQQSGGQWEGPYPPQQMQNQQPQNGGSFPIQQAQHQQSNFQQFPQQPSNFQQFPQNFQGMGQQAHGNYNMQQGNMQQGGAVPQMQSQMQNFQGMPHQNYQMQGSVPQQMQSNQQWQQWQGQGR